MSADTDIKPAEARVSPRRRALKAGIIAFKGHFITYPCTLREISETGARLRVDDVRAIPDEFDLVIELDAVEYPCATVWRRQNDIGVRFTGPPRQKAPKRTQIVNVVRPEQKPTLRRKV